MRKIILMCILSFSIAKYTIAQGLTESTSPLTVSIDLTKDVLSITLNGSTPVDFKYEVAADYLTDKNVDVTSQFTVVSNRKYNVTVKAATEFTSSPAPSTVPALNSVNVGVRNPAAPNGVTYSTVQLSLSDQQLISNAESTLSTAYEIRYSIPQSAAANFLSLARQKYSTNITYTATQL